MIRSNWNNTTSVRDEFWGGPGFNTPSAGKRMRSRYGVTYLAMFFSLPPLMAYCHYDYLENSIKVKR